VSAEGRNNGGRKSQTARKMAARLKKTALRRAENQEQRFFPQPVKPHRFRILYGTAEAVPYKDLEVAT
jgi:hypothetical protein